MQIDERNYAHIVLNKSTIRTKKTSSFLVQVCKMNEHRTRFWQRNQAARPPVRVTE